VDAHSALTTVATVLLLSAVGVGVYVWLAYARWSEHRFRGRGERLRSYEVLAALRAGDDRETAAARRAFLRSLGLFAGVLVLAVVLLELRELV
jgi:hypothetical protein